MGVKRTETLKIYNWRRNRSNVDLIKPTTEA